MNLKQTIQRNKTLDDMLERSERMEKYYLEKAIEYAKYSATNIDVDAMVTKFKDDLIGEVDSATTQRIAETYGKYYRQGIEDALKAIRGTRKDDSK